MLYSVGRHNSTADHTLELRVHGRVIPLRNVPTKGVKFEAKCFEYITWRLDVLRIREYIHVVDIFKTYLNIWMHRSFMYVHKSFEA